MPMAVWQEVSTRSSGGEGCGYAASLGQRKRVAHIPTAKAEAAGSGLIFFEGQRAGAINLSPSPVSREWVHFNITIGVTFRPWIIPYPMRECFGSSHRNKGMEFSWVPKLLMEVGLL